MNISKEDFNKVKKISDLILLAAAIKIDYKYKVSPLLSVEKDVILQYPSHNQKSNIFESMWFDSTEEEHIQVFTIEDFVNAIIVENSNEIKIGEIRIILFDIVPRINRI